MIRVLNRAPHLVAAAAVAFFFAACSENPASPVANDFAIGKSVLAAAYIIDTGPGGTSSIGSSGMFASGSTTCSPQPACAAHFQFLAGKFTLTRAANVQSVEGWMSVGVGGALNVHIRTDSTPPAGAHIPGHSLHTAQYNVSAQTFNWKAFTSFNVTLQPGTYWVTFEPVANGTFNGGMTGVAASPLADYAFFADGNNRWVPFSAFNENPAFGFRVYGEGIVTPTEQINDLMAYVSGAGLPRANVMKINGSLQKAADALAASNTAGACANLQAAIDYVNKQGARKIPSSVATEIISKANAIRADIGC